MSKKYRAKDAKMRQVAEAWVAAGPKGERGVEFHPTTGDCFLTQTFAAHFDSENVPESILIHFRTDGPDYPPTQLAIHQCMMRALTYRVQLRLDEAEVKLRKAHESMACARDFHRRLHEDMVAGPLPEPAPAKRVKKP